MSVFRVMLGDGCNFISSRQLTKPVEFYVFFAIAELYGLWSFWFCVKKLKSDIEKSGDVDLEKIGKAVEVNALDENQNFELLQVRDDAKESKAICSLNYFADDVRNLMFLLTGEIPMLMILEFFYVERPLGSDGFFQNPLISINNFLTSFEIFVLLMAATDILIDNLIDSKGRPLKEAEGVGAPDGRIDLMEVLIIIDTVCITIAGVIRLFVNSANNLNWDEDLIESMRNSRGCLSLYWNAGVLTPVDFVYLVMCLIPLFSIVFVIWSLNTDSFILSKVIVYQHEKTDKYMLDQFQKEIQKDLADEAFYDLCIKYEEIDLRFVLFARGKQSKFLEQKNKIAMKKAKERGANEKKVNIISWILNYKPDIIKYLHTINDLLIHTEDKFGDTAFLLACERAHLETVKLLVELGADINKTAFSGRNGKW